ncbi:MAG: hypothetical protein ACFE8M_13925 [Candidatus Hermodarchaeota archaeon]
MFFEKFNDWPSKKITRILLIIGVIFFIIIIPLMIVFYELSDYPVSFFESQLSFSGAVIKFHFSFMNAEELNYYLIWLIVDYGFMLGFGIIYFSLDLILARKFDESSRWRKSGYIAAMFGILYFCCDAIENIFIFTMLNDPLGFPDILALTHSWIALVKYIFNFSSGFWVIAAVIILFFRRKSK